MTESLTRTDESSTGPEPRPEPGRGRGSRLPVAVLLGVLVGTLCSLALGPHSPDLSGSSRGDVQLVRDLRDSLVSDRGFQTLSVARLRSGQVAFAGLATRSATPPGPETPFELGSVTKTFTGLLLADGVARGELRLDDRLAQHLPELRGTPVGGVTLVELATQHSGVPELPPSLATRAAMGVLGDVNPYAGITTADVVAAAGRTPLTGRGQYRYSNLGISLLGHAEARAARVRDWPTLVQDRVWGPLGMTSTHVALVATDVPVTPAGPHHDNGWPAPSWYGPGFAPAGSSTWTTAADLTRYASALLSGRAPGMAALRPLTSAGPNRIGLVWQVTEVSGRTLTWHNGATAGYHSTLALDLARRQAVVVLGNSSRPADRAAFALAATPAGAAVPAVEPAPRWTAATTLVALVSLVLLAQTGWQGCRCRSRLGLVTLLLTGLVSLALLLGHGPWQLVPGWLFGATAGATAVFAGVAVLRGRALPLRPLRRPVLAWLNLTVTVLALAVAGWLL